MTDELLNSPFRETYLTEENQIRVVHPPNQGWIEKKLNKEELAVLWEYIEDREEDSCKNNLAGNIHESNNLEDRFDWFFNNTLYPLIQKYAEQFGDLGTRRSVGTADHPYKLRMMWVNYQKQGEFNPLHDHTGVYSFVVWMKIPTDWKEQNKIPIASNSNCPKVSTFCFTYTDILGLVRSATFPLSTESEGTLVFFPASLSHQVYPFFNCDEDRISISGNIALDTRVVI